MMFGELDYGPLKVPVSGLSSLLQGMLSAILSFAKGHRQVHRPSCSVMPAVISFDRRCSVGFLVNFEAADVGTGCIASLRWV